MKKSVADFSNYELPVRVTELADGLLPEIAAAAQFKLPAEPSEAVLSELVGRLGPDKELQRNIGTVKETLGEHAHNTVADWVDRSGVMLPVSRAFASNRAVPEQVDTLMLSGGVANWMLRRAAVVERFDPDTVGRVMLPVGARKMGAAEHQLVASIERRTGLLPTEAEFAHQYLAGRLAIAGFDLYIDATDETNGDAILASFFANNPNILEGTVVVAANAPNAIQATGQIAAAARKTDPLFNSGGEQLFMVGDSFPVARHGEAPRDAQNPYTALGQLARNALFLERSNPR